LQVYREELPYEDIKKWQPREVMAAMLSVDEFADKSGTILMVREATSGVVDDDTPRISLGTDHRFSLKWANSNHSALGNFVHAPTIEQLEKGKPTPLAKIVKRATEMITECERVLNSSTYNFNMMNSFTLECTGCKEKTLIRIHDPQQKQVATCRKCSAQYDVEFGEGQTVKMKLHAEDWDCPSYTTQNFVGLHLVKEGNTVTCTNCGHEMKVNYHLIDKDMRSSGMTTSPSALGHNTNGDDVSGSRCGRRIAAVVHHGGD
jgi:hypothetical protein